MRVFIAINIPEAVCDALEAVQDQVPVGRLMTPETLHLTLAFLGEQPEAVVIAVDEELRRLRDPAFTVQLRGLGTFGARSPTVLWAGIVSNPALVALRTHVRGAVRRAGLDLPRERFRPHITLARYGARLRGDEAERLRLFLTRFGGIALPDLAVDRIALIQSRRTSAGAVHDVLADYPLGS